ncbi:uncharacterized protein LOC142546392 isoform X2 [Primulina tabacum]|uniref:uncharacterized protein LOC142546392 isoform X2 n=1 Tax=Primulina tabacum TaxID=48773 RepID=UPI003F5A8710
MAQELDDGEFWLPSEFLTDDDLLTDFKKKGGDDFSCGFGNSFGLYSNLSSPVESVTGSTENESDEDDFISFLTQKMNYSALNDSKKGWLTSASPQSTLLGCKPVSSPVSPKSDSKVSSPPRSEVLVSWDLFYAAAKKVSRLRVNEAALACYQQKMTYPPLKSSPVTVPLLNRCQASGFCPNPITQAQLTDQKVQAFQHLKNEVWVHGLKGNKFQNENKIGGVEEIQGLSAAAWPTLLQSQRQPQQIPSSGMRTVFLSENGAKKERTGTGVFLPRGYRTNSMETSGKPGSTVLLPDRVVHALNLNICSMDTLAQTKSRGVQFNADPGFKRKINTRMAQHGRNLTPPPVVNQEFCLPQEWTY